VALSRKEERYPVLFYVCGGGGSPEWGTDMASQELGFQAVVNTNDRIHI